MQADDGATPGESLDLLQQIHQTLFEVGPALARLVTARCCSMGAETLLAGHIYLPKHQSI